MAKLINPDGYLICAHIDGSIVSVLLAASALTDVNHLVKNMVDAAHRFHPLAGQGVNLGFGDVTCLRDVLTKAVYDGSDLGSLSYLVDYETERQRKVLPVIATIEFLQRLYNTNLTPLVLLRSVGLQATNTLTFIKERIIKEATS